MTRICRVYLLLHGHTLAWIGFKPGIYNKSNYRTRTIIARDLYTFYSIFENQNRFLRGFLHKILALCMVSIQERFTIVIVVRVR